MRMARRERVRRGNSIREYPSHVYTVNDKIEWTIIRRGFNQFSSFNLSFALSFHLYVCVCKSVSVEMNAISDDGTYSRGEVTSMK